MARIVSLLAAAAACTMTVSAQTARLQVVHNAADPMASVVDVYVNGVLTLDDFAFRTATNFLEVPAGVELRIGVAPSSSGSAADVLATVPVTLAADGRYIAVANGVLNPASFAANPDPAAAAIGFNLYAADNVSPASGAEGSVDIRVFHGATDAPKVDILAGNNRIVDGLSYGSFTSTLTVPAASYTLGVAPAGGSPIAAYTADVTALAGQSIFVMASGFLSPSANQDGPAFGLFVVTASGDVIALPPATSAPGVELQIVHNAADPAAAEVDIYVNGELALDNFAFRTATPFLPFDANVAYTVAVAPGTSTSVNDALATFPIQLPAGRYIAVANGVLNPASFAANPDVDAEPIAFTIYPVSDVRGAAAAAGNVDILVFHGATDAPKVDILAGTTRLIEGLSYGDWSSYLSVPAAAYTLGVAPAGGAAIANFDVDLTSLSDRAIAVLASGFLTPAANNDGPSFALLAVLPNGQTLVINPGTANVAELAPLPSAGIVPNPVVTSADVTFSLPVDANVTMTISSAAGMIVSQTSVGNLSAGEQRLPLRIAELATGAYYVRIQAGQYGSTLPLTIVR